ncbi:MAG: ABC transporter family substrate-binding protein [Micromonosporaceae bacterium]|nr:ABC transporter family substrate-binding protein [Micromonosporaceae bacterium]
MRKTILNIAAAGAAAALVLAGCSSDGDGAPESVGFEDCAENPNTCNSGDREPGGEITWLLDATPDGFFPWSPEGGSVYTLQAVHGILPNFGQFMPDGEYAYNMDVLAEEPQITSEDPFQTTWQIRPEAVWDDGTPISADDLIMSWKMSTPEEDGHCVGCRPRSFEELIANVEGSDDGKTVTVTYKDGVADPEWFSYSSVHGIIGGIAPAHVGINEGFFSGTPDEWDPEGLGEYFEFLNDNPPEFSGGPYMIESFDIDTQIVMVPNPSWYGAEQPTLERVIKVFNDADASWVPALQNNEINGGSPSAFAPDAIRQMLDMANVRVDMQPGPSWAHLDMNMDNEWLGEHKELRQAIFTAIDSNDMAQRIYGDLFPEVTVRTNHLHSVGGKYHQDHTTATGQGTGDIELARQILADAGFEGMDGGAGALTFEGETVGPFRLRAGISPANTTSTQLEQASLAEIGIQADLEPTDDLGGTLGEQNYDIMQFGWSGSPLFFGTGLQFWKSDSPSNFGKYNNEQVDALIEQEQQATTLDDSATLHDQMMEIVVDDAYVLPLYDTPVFIFVTEDYINIRDNTNTSLRAIYSEEQWGLAATE